MTSEQHCTVYKLRINDSEEISLMISFVTLVKAKSTVCNLERSFSSLEMCLVRNELISIPYNITATVLGLICRRSKRNKINVLYRIFTLKFFKTYSKSDWDCSRNPSGKKIVAKSPVCHWRKRQNIFYVFTLKFE